MAHTQQDLSQVAPLPVRNWRAAALHLTETRGIEPVDGWRLLEGEERDGDRFWTPYYVAVRGAETVQLDVSRFRFTPSQDRFAWLVRNGFPPRPAFGPWDDADIEDRLAAERSALA